MSDLLHLGVPEHLLEAFLARQLLARRLPVLLEDHVPVPLAKTLADIVGIYCVYRIKALLFETRHNNYSIIRSEKVWSQDNRY